jgi:hypothetical protein
VPTALNHGYVYADARVHADLKRLMSKLPYPAVNRGLTEAHNGNGDKYFKLP